MANMMNFENPQVDPETVHGYAIADQPAAGLSQAPFGTQQTEAEGIDVVEDENGFLLAEKPIVSNEIDVGLEGITAVITMMVMHLGVLVMMISYGVPPNSLVNILGFVYLLVMVLFYGGIVIGYYCDKQMPPVILTTVLPWMFTISMVILLVIATTLVQQDMSLVTSRPKTEITVITTEGNAAGPGETTAGQNGAKSTTGNIDGKGEMKKNSEQNSETLGDVTELKKAEQIKIQNKIDQQADIVGE